MLNKKSRFSVLVIASLLLAPLCSHAATAGDTVDAFHAALHAGNKDSALAILSPDVTIFESGHVERSRAEYAAHHLADDVAFAGISERRVLRRGERSGNDQAVIWEESETIGRSKGKPVHLLGIETTILVKAGDRWTIVHVHWSSRQVK